MSDAAGSPGGVPAELRRVHARFSDLQQQLKDQALAHGLNPAWAPFVSLYATTWVSLLRAWQKFYADYKDWDGRSWQWTHQAELDRLVGRLESVRDQAVGLAPISSASASAPTTPTVVDFVSDQSTGMPAYVPIAIAGAGVLVVLALTAGRGA